MLAVTFVLGSALAGCDHGPPAPPEALVQIRACVENGDSIPTAVANRTVSTDIFSTPGGITPRQETPAAASTVKTLVTRTAESASSQTLPEMKPRTTARFCEVWARRTGADGIKHSIYRTFYVWQDAAGAWHWMRNPRPSSLEDNQ